MNPKPLFLKCVLLKFPHDNDPFLYAQNPGLRENYYFICFDINDRDERFHVITNDGDMAKLYKRRFHGREELN